MPGTKKRKILLVTDMKWRDLCGNVYLKILLEKYYNVEVFLSRLGEEKVKTHFYKPDLIILNNLLSQENVDFSYYLKKKGIAVCVLPTEGMPGSKFVDLAAGRFSDYSCIDLYLSWNSLIKNRMLDLNILPENKIKIIGVPRFDFYTYPLNKLHPSKTDIQKKFNLNINSQAPIILYASNFVYLCYKNNVETLYAEIEKYGVTNFKNSSKNDLILQLEAEHYTRAKALEIVKKLLNDFPELQIIYKAHPAEDHQFYEDYIKSFQNEYPGRFAFVVKEYIWSLLAVCDLIIQRSCTTGHEAWILDKPSLQTYFHPQERLKFEEYEKGNNIITSYEECSTYVKYYLNGGRINPSILDYRKKLLSEWYYKIDGQRTLETTHIIGDFIGAQPKNTYPFYLKEDTKFMLKEYPKHVLRVLRNSYLLKTNSYDRIHRLDKIYSKKDVKVWTGKIHSVLNSS